MTYDEKLNWYRSQIDKLLSSSLRRDREYGNYLRRWFSEEDCDGAPFSLKYRWKREPMSFLVYFMG